MRGLGSTRSLTGLVLAFCFGVPLTEPKSRNKGTLMKKGLLRNLRDLDC